MTLTTTLIKRNNNMLKTHIATLYVLTGNQKTVIGLPGRLVVTKRYLSQIRDIVYYKDIQKERREKAMLLNLFPFFRQTCDLYEKVRKKNKDSLEGVERLQQDNERLQQDKETSKTSPYSKKKRKVDVTNDQTLRNNCNDIMKDLQEQGLLPEETISCGLAFKELLTVNQNVIKKLSKKPTKNILNKIYAFNNTYYCEEKDIKNIENALYKILIKQKANKLTKDDKLPNSHKLRASSTNENVFKETKSLQDFFKLFIEKPSEDNYFLYLLNKIIPLDKAFAYIMSNLYTREALGNAAINLTYFYKTVGESILKFLYNNLNKRKVNKLACLTLGIENLKVLNFRVLESPIDILKSLKNFVILAKKDIPLLSVKKIQENMDVLKVLITILLFKDKKKLSGENYMILDTSYKTYQVLVGAIIEEHLREKGFIDLITHKKKFKVTEKLINFKIPADYHINLNFNIRLPFLGNPEFRYELLETSVDNTGIRLKMDTFQKTYMEHQNIDTYVSPTQRPQHVALRLNLPFLSSWLILLENILESNKDTLLNMHKICALFFEISYKKRHDPEYYKTNKLTYIETLKKLFTFTLKDSHKQWLAAFITIDIKNLYLNNKNLELKLNQAFAAFFKFDLKMTIYEFVTKDFTTNENSDLGINTKFIQDICNLLEAKKHLLKLLLNNSSLLINFDIFRFLEFFDARGRKYLQPYMFSPYLPELRPFLSFSNENINLSLLKKNKDLLINTLGRVIEKSLKKNDQTSYAQFITNIHETYFENNERVPYKALLKNNNIKLKEINNLYSILYDLYSIVTMKNINLISAIGEDAVASGLQLMALNFNFAKLAYFTKLITRDRLLNLAKKQGISLGDLPPEEISLYDSCVSHVEIEAKKISVPKKFKHLLPETNDRVVVKGSVMISFYTAGPDTRVALKVENFKKICLKKGKRYTEDDLIWVKAYFYKIDKIIQAYINETVPELSIIQKTFFKHAKILHPLITLQTTRLKKSYNNYKKSIFELRKQGVILKGNIRENNDFNIKKFKVFLKHEPKNNFYAGMLLESQLQYQNLLLQLNTIKEKITKLTSLCNKILEKLSIMPKTHSFSPVTISYTNILQFLRGKDKQKLLNLYKKNELLNEYDTALKNNAFTEELIPNLRFAYLLRPYKLRESPRFFKYKKRRLKVFSVDVTKINYSNLGSAFWANGVQGGDAALLQDIQDLNFIDNSNKHFFSVHDCFYTRLDHYPIFRENIKLAYRFAHLKQDLYNSLKRSPQIMHILNDLKKHQFVKLESPDDLDNPDFIDF